MAESIHHKDGAPPAPQRRVWGWLRERTRADMLFAVLVVLALGIVFGLQAPNTGFYGPNHGWTSTHGLAIMRHATPTNGFVGYAMQYRGADGSTHYDYFDRYPFFFSAGMGALLSLTDSLPLQVQIARQAMNIVYVATLAAAWLLALRLLGGDRWRALAAVLLAFSGYWLVFYKDMIHYDQPALFGAFLLLLALAHHKLDANGGARRGVYIAALVAVALGRGYASYAVLGVWLLWELAAGLRGGERLRRAAFPLRVLLLAVLWGALLLGYNLLAESVRRDVSLAQTSIVDSAVRRLPFFGDKDLGRTVGKNVPPWHVFAGMEFERLVRWTLPVRLTRANPAALAFGAVMWLAAAVYVWRQRDAARRFVAFMAAFWGVFWLAFMINLAHGHEYVTMYAVGLPLVFYVALMAWLPRRAWITAAALMVAFAAQIASNAQVRAELLNPETNRAAYTADYNRIAARMDGTGRVVHSNISDGRCVIDNDYCYVLGFYLGEHYLGPPEIADYVISRLPYFYASPPFLPPDDAGASLQLVTDSLTPENTTAHLFDMSAAQTRHLPEDAQTLVTFGERLTLQHWSLRESVEVAACQRVHVESWWLATDKLDANYSMQVALVDANGEGVAKSNSDLSLLPTGVWVAGMYHLDARYLDMPCDIAPGEYPLVMSVYDPDAESSLTVHGGDGAPVGDYFYLTTLFVR